MVINFKLNVVLFNGLNVNYRKESTAGGEGFYNTSVLFDSFVPVTVRIKLLDLINFNRMRMKGYCKVTISKSNLFDFNSLTCEVFQALADVSALSAAAPPVVLAGPRIAEVDLGLAVIPGETDRTAAPQPVDGVDGPEQNRVRGDEGRGAVKLQHRHTLHIVLTGLPQADVVIKRQHLERRLNSYHIKGEIFSKTPSSSCSWEQISRRLKSPAGVKQPWYSFSSPLFESSSFNEPF